MKELKVLVVSGIALMLLQYTAIAQSTPSSHPDLEWGFMADYSDEFNSETLDITKWNTNVNDWGTWSWEPENAYIKDNALALKMQHSPHVRGGKDYYFTSGISRIDKTITYGYFEARIKGCEKWPGAAPAFWLYSVGQPTPTEEGGVQYSEIDVVELFQVVGSLHDIEMNLHARIIKDGELTWIRPGQGFGEITRNNWEAPFDVRDDFHTYGVHNRVDSIFWYIDGIERGKKKNLYWHLPMHVTVSMGLRNPYEKYINGVRTIVDTPDAPEGFPTEMSCDYVRVWEAKPQITVDENHYSSTDFDLGSELSFEGYYDAGSGFQVVNEGLTVKLLEKNEVGETINEVSSTDANVLGTQAGNFKINIPLSGLKTTDKLPPGNSYSIVSHFESSKESGLIVSKEIQNINIVELILSNNDLEEGFGNKEWMIYPNPASDMITIKGSSKEKMEVIIYDLSGVEQLRYSIEDSTSISIATLQPGMYLAKLLNGTGRILKLIKE